MFWLVAYEKFKARREMDKRPNNGTINTLWRAVIIYTRILWYHAENLIIKIVRGKPERKS